MSNFVLHPKLNIPIPRLEKDWNSYSIAEKESILMEWEQIRGSIPDYIKNIEQEIQRKQSKLNEEEDFEKSCLLNSEISELASMINDFWILFRQEGVL
ncbi:hypothetical protein [Salirhabdus sp. Marseille-P4669]|uniref:hypothetical protein n=1 Tax=Salirhabdus sp. Marseille-P4669 TaxID=2042310 RepID=UPI000C7BD5B1|nr:hypothetical protein [Salirhabdus sp. Marseille-P4669]